MKRKKTLTRKGKTSSMEADWSQLPVKLLQLISEKLNDSELYLIRFRSVCSTWRSSSISLDQNPKPLKLPKPQFVHFHTNHVISYLIKHKFFLIKPPKQQRTVNRGPWLIRIGPDDNGKTKLWNPFAVKHLLPYSANMIDFNKLPVLDFVQVPYLTQTFSCHFYGCIMRVATCQGGQLPPVIVAIDVNGEPIMCRWEDHRWVKVPNMSTSQRGNNICVFKGQPCVVDKTGRTVMIGPDLSIHLIALPVFGGESKVLVVSSEFELLLVDIYRKNRDIVWIDVFSLDEKEKRWVKLTNLGDRVLFLGCNYSFSVSFSASDLGFANGNCVIYNTSYDIQRIDCGMSVFHLDQGRVSPLSDYPDYCTLLWPPPKWIGARERKSVRLSRMAKFGNMRS